MEGYINKKPDTAYWIQQVQLGLRFRKRWAYEDQWSVWQKYYRGEWEAGTVPMNLFFTMVRTIVPRVYYRNPSVSVTPEKPGILEQSYARMAERIINKTFVVIDLKNQMKRTVQNAFLYGTGWTKTGFNSINTPSPATRELDDGMTKKGERLEYTPNAIHQMPWAMSTHTRDVVVPAGTTQYSDARWVCHRIWRSVEDVRADPRFKNTKDLPAGATIMTNPDGSSVNLQSINEYEQRLVELYEIRDAKTGAVMVIAPGKSDNNVLYFSYDDMQFDGFPLHPLQFNVDTDVFWAVPDSQILSPYQVEANEVRTQIMKHRRMTLVRILAKKGAISQTEAAKMVQEVVSPVVWVEGDVQRAVKVMQGGNIPQDLYQTASLIQQDVRETVGFSRNQFGEFNSGSGDTSATEAQIVNSASELRVDERRDAVADHIVAVANNVMHTVFNYWTPQDVIDIVGPGGYRIWVQAPSRALRDTKYSIKVDPDSALPETKALREQKALNLYSVLRTNPLIDPVQLTQYLLHELHGVQFDDMMRAMPAPSGGVPQGPVGADQLGGLITQSVQEAGPEGMQAAAAQAGGVNARI